VADLGLREGMYVTPQLELFAIADLSGVWVQVDVFEHQMVMIEAGRPAEITVAAIPGEVFEGEVDYIYPELDPVTRTLRVRLRFPNPKGRLKPNMLADVVIYGGPKRDVLMVPREAVILSGRGARVVKALGEGRFQPVEVRTGIGNSEVMEILSGLDEDERVVVSGQFLIDSESNLRASFARMTGGSKGSAVHQH
jgi:Cu(I)/Ag(I) efflux system membrane fusion protein